MARVRVSSRRLPTGRAKGSSGEFDYFVVGVGNGLILGYLMYRSGLVPRRMAVLGLVGGPLVCVSGIAVLFDVFEQGGSGQGLATIPEFLWELSLGIWLTVKGFKRSPILDPAPNWP